MLQVKKFHHDQSAEERNTIRRLVTGNTRAVPDNNITARTYWYRFNVIYIVQHTQTTSRPTD